MYLIFNFFFANSKLEIICEIILTRLSPLFDYWMFNVQCWMKVKYIKLHVFYSHEERYILMFVYPLINLNLYNGNHGKDTYLTKYGLVGNYWLPTNEHSCNQTSCTKIDLWRPSVSMYQIYTSHICFVLKKKVTFYCINWCLYHHVSTCTCTAVTMAKIQCITVTCFLGGVVSVTDKEFEVRAAHDWTVIFTSNIFNIYH